MRIQKEIGRRLWCPGPPAHPLLGGLWQSTSGQHGKWACQSFPLCGAQTFPGFLDILTLQHINLCGTKFTFLRTPLLSDAAAGATAFGTIYGKPEKPFVFVSTALHNKVNVP